MPENAIAVRPGELPRKRADIVSWPAMTRVTMANGIGSYRQRGILRASTSGILGALSNQCGKLKGLRPWLCSSRWLLRESPQRGSMYRRSPLMRSLLSQFRTPTHPRRSVGFFGFGHLAGRPARLITQSNSDWLVLLCQPFRPSTPATVTGHSQKSTQSFGAIEGTKAVHNRKCKWLEWKSLLCRNFCAHAFTQKHSQRDDDWKSPKGNKKIVLTE